jgi:hypothetical protein
MPEPKSPPAESDRSSTSRDTIIEALSWADGIDAGCWGYDRAAALLDDYVRERMAQAWKQGEDASDEWHSKNNSRRDGDGSQSVPEPVNPYSVIPESTGSRVTTEVAVERVEPILRRYGVAEAEIGACCNDLSPHLRPSGSPRGRRYSQRPTPSVQDG